MPDNDTTPEQREAYRQQVEAKLSARSLRSLSPCKRWRGTGYFDVPGWVLREMAAERLIEMRKLSGSSPTEWRR